MKFSIYLAGNIQKGHEKKSVHFWTEEDKALLQTHLPHVHLSFLNPATRNDDLSNQKAVFGRDMMQVFCADLVLVDARERRGLGVGAEMMWAKMNQIPVLVLAPCETHYKKLTIQLLGKEVKNWVHPFVESLSDRVVEDLVEATMWISEFLLGNIQEIKGPQFIRESMKEYLDTQYEIDHPMRELSSANISLKTRMENLER